MTAAAANCPSSAGSCISTAASKLRIGDCEFLQAGGNALALEQCEGEVARCLIEAAADNAIFSLDSGGLIIAANTIRGSGNGGIRVWQSAKRRDGSLIADNRIEDTAARAGGTGENGNAINVFKRRQRDRAQQHHPQGGVFGDPRQRRLRHPDRRQ